MWREGNALSDDKDAHGVRSNRDGGRLEPCGGRRVHELPLPGLKDHERQQQKGVIRATVAMIADDCPQGVWVEDAAAQTPVAQEQSLHERPQLLPQPQAKPLVGLIPFYAELGQYAAAEIGAGLPKRAGPNNGPGVGVDDVEELRPPTAEDVRLDRVAELHLKWDGTQLVDELVVQVR